jgi:predicted hydrocarbon binding protein
LEKRGPAWDLMQDIVNILRGIMNVSRHISIDDEYLHKMEPYLEKHNGNMGAALREMISQAGKFNPCLNSSAVDSSLFNWMLAQIEDSLVHDDVLDKLINPALVNSMEKLEDHVNKRLNELEWRVDLSLECDSDDYPSQILMITRGPPQKIKFISGIMSQFLVKNSLDRSPLEIRSVTNFNEYMKVELTRSNKTAAQESLIKFFGGMNEITKTIKSRPEFWIPVVRGHIESNYNMVTIHRNYFEDILANKIPVGETTIENLAKTPIHEIPLTDLLALIKEVYENSRIVDRVDIEKDTLIIYHNYRTMEAVDKIKKIILNMLEASGHLYDGRSTANMILLTPRPDIGIKINELIEELRKSSNRVDQELLMFIIFLNGLKDIPDIPLSLSILGRRLGISIMQAYEKENNIMNWNLESFKKAFETIDSRLHRDSDWNMDGKNLHYSVRKCNLASNGNNVDPCICHTIRETFKGALGYAFRNKAMLDVHKLLFHGDNYCEVIIRIQ